MKRMIVVLLVLITTSAMAEKFEFWLNWDIHPVLEKNEYNLGNGHGFIHWYGYHMTNFPASTEGYLILAFDGYSDPNLQMLFWKDPSCTFWFDDYIMNPVIYNFNFDVDGYRRMMGFVIYVPDYALIFPAGYLNIVMEANPVDYY